MLLRYGRMSEREKKQSMALFIRSLEISKMWQKDQHNDGNNEELWNEMKWNKLLNNY